MTKRLALLGYDPKARGLLQALSRCGDVAIASFCCIESKALTRLLELFPAARVLSSWEELVSEELPDALLVCGFDETNLEGARQLASEKVPVYLVPDARQGSAFIYSLSLVHDDNQVRLIAVPRLAGHPLVDELNSQIQSGRLGELRLIRLERHVEADSTTGLSKSLVDQVLLDDAAVLRQLGGSYSRVTAVHSGASDDAVSQATVTLAGQELTEATWTCRTGPPAWSLTVTGAAGEAVLKLDPDTVVGSIEFRPEDSGGGDAAPASSVATTEVEAGDALASRVADADSSDHRTAWAEITRVFETVEATHASLRRRRTVDLYFETTSERSIFKSQMTALGCGLILLTLFSLVAFLLLGAFLDSRSLTQKSAIGDKRVITDTDFTGSELNEQGKKHVKDLIARLRRRPDPVFVMPDTQSDDESTSDQRLKSVADEFTNLGHPENVALLQLADVPHPATQTILQILRIAWIAPLVLFLGLQLLLFITRPSANETKDETGPPPKPDEGPA